MGDSLNINGEFIYHTEDDFLDDFDSFREVCINQSYSDVTSPFDNIKYPNVNTDVSSDILEETKEKIEQVLGKKIVSDVFFTRLSLNGGKPPHQAHTDCLTGDIVFLLYLNDEKDCVGGTELVSHIENGMCINPQNDEELDLWKRDVNVEDKWQRDVLVKMKPNRAFIMDSGLMHRSQPISGFGDSAENGRLVMIGFLRVAK